MALTNAERQARWRERREAELEALRAATKGMVSIATLRKQLKPLLADLKAEGKKHPAAMSPGTVMHRTVMIERVLDELAGVTPPQRRA